MPANGLITVKQTVHPRGLVWAPMSETPVTPPVRRPRDRPSPSRRRRGHLVARRSWRDLARPLAILLGAAFLLFAVVTVVIRFAPELTFELAFVIPAVLLIGLVLFLLPVQTLPAIVLAILAVFPMRLIPSDGPFNALPPLAILMGIWVFRRLVLGHRPAGATGIPPDADDFAPRFGVYVMAVLMVAWLLTSLVVTVGDETSIGWTMSFIASVLLPLLVFDARHEARLLAGTFLVVGALVGVYLLGEMLIGYSPLYGPINALVGSGAEEELEFSVYRASAGFAHPLFAAAFLSIPSAMGVGMWLMSGRLLPLVAAALSGAGVLATVSRGSLAAVAVAVAFGILFAPVFIGWRNIARWLQLVVLTAIAGLLALNFGPLVERTESMESQISAGVRERAFDIAVKAANASGWVGTGAGTSGETGRLYDSIVIENSMLQLLMSLGAPGLLLFVLFIGALIWAAWRHANLAVIMGIIAYVVSITSFNSLDAVRSMHVVLGFLVIMAINRPLQKRSAALDELPTARDELVLSR